MQNFFDHRLIFDGIVLISYGLVMYRISKGQILALQQQQSQKQIPKKQQLNISIHPLLPQINQKLHQQIPQILKIPQIPFELNSINNQINFNIEPLPQNNKLDKLITQNQQKLNLMESDNIETINEQIIPNQIAQQEQKVKQLDTSPISGLKNVINTTGILMKNFINDTFYYQENKYFYLGFFGFSTISLLLFKRHRILSFTKKNSYLKTTNMNLEKQILSYQKSIKNLEEHLKNKPKVTIRDKIIAGLVGFLNVMGLYHIFKNTKRNKRND